MFEYIVTYEGVKVIVRTENKNEIASSALAKLTKIVPNMDDIASMKIEVFHEGFQSYFTATDNEDIPDSGKLKLSNLGHQDTEYTKPAPTNANDLMTQLQPPIEVTMVQREPLSSQGLPVNSSWPKPFRIPTDRFPSSLRHELTNLKGFLAESSKSTLLGILYETITAVSFYPTPEQYGSVVTALLMQYPQLDYKLSTGDAEKYWRTSLSAKMRNMRQKRDRNIECVVVSRDRFKVKKAAAAATNGSLPFTDSAAYGVKHYLAQRAEGEDDASIARHIESMKSEQKKRTKDYRQIDFAMEKTFGDRRQYLVNHSPSLLQIQEKYPCLFDANQLLYDFQRLTDMECIPTIKSSLKKYGPAILKLQGTPLPDSVQENPEKVAHLALLSIAKLMKEQVFESNDETITAPKLKFTVNLAEAELDVEGELIVEDMSICPVAGILHGVSVWLASYFVLNLQYPNTFRKTLLFIQKILLDIQPKFRISSAITNTQRKLNCIIDSC